MGYISKDWLQSADRLARGTCDSCATSKRECRMQGWIYTSHVSWGVHILFSSLARAFCPSVAFDYTNALDFPYGHLVYLFFVLFSRCSCIVPS